MAACAALYLTVGLAWYKQDTEIARLKQSNAEGQRVESENKRIKDDFAAAKKVEEVRDNLTPLVGLSFERDLILKIMDDINPNIPNNGDEKLTDLQRLWVVDWKFEEKPKIDVGAAPPTKEGSRPFPTSKNMTAILEVVILKRNNEAEATNFIINTLLNYNPSTRKPTNEGKPCVIDKWKLMQGASTLFWSVQKQATDLPWPQPNTYHGLKADDNAPKNYWRYLVTLDLPVGDEARKAASLPVNK